MKRVLITGCASGSGALLVKGFWGKDRLVNRELGVRSAVFLASMPEIIRGGFLEFLYRRMLRKKA